MSMHHIPAKLSQLGTYLVNHRKNEKKKALSKRKAPNKIHIAEKTNL